MATGKSDETFVTYKHFVGWLLTGLGLIVTVFLAVFHDVAEQSDIDRIDKRMEAFQDQLLAIWARDLSHREAALEVEKQHVAAMQEDVKAHRDLAAAIRSVNLAHTMLGDATVNACPQSTRDAVSAFLFNKIKDSE